MAEQPQIVLWMEGERGPRFSLDAGAIEAAGGVTRFVTCRTDAERAEAVADARVLVAAHVKVTADLYRAGKGLAGVIRTGIGLDTVDVPAATQQGVCIAHVPDFCYDEVADSAWALLLAVARKLPEAGRRVRSGEWVPNNLLPVHSLRGRTLGLVAFGHIGRKVAERGRAFGMRIVAADPYVDQAAMAKEGAEKVSLEELLARADVVSLHTPLTPETRGLMNAAAFARMKPGAILLNTSRGPVVDEPALIEALRSGRLAGAGLDVLQQEPPATDNPLFTMENVVLSPHSSSTTVEALEDLARKVNMQIVQMLRGEWPAYLANKAVRTQPNVRLTAGRVAAS
ncbi:MAG TPA: C-terminal binding protein [bacterium]|nr:C-terminal binding protein [bacterium]